MHYPRTVEWFNDTEHELFWSIGYPIDQMIQDELTKFVIVNIHLRVIGSTAYRDRVVIKVSWKN